MTELRPTTCKNCGSPHLAPVDGGTCSCMGGLADVTPEQFIARAQSWGGFVVYNPERDRFVAASIDELPEYFPGGK
ncbi:hypothetical protein [Marinobacterium litorale]|uniref:hypothetical protein n=1 Tax=Marinobacterium litorale TaxID=404770 RepID=UPI0012ECB394|nr:hypothetical protein [Marinobacterium litorale]